MSYQKYYVPEQSKFPIYAATALFLLVMGAAGTINPIAHDKVNALNKLIIFRLYPIEKAFRQKYRLTKRRIKNK